MKQFFRFLFFGFCLLTASAQSANDSPLYQAIEKGDAATVEALLAKGADINAKDKNGGTPLLFATALGNKELTKLLLARGADATARTSSGESLLHNAALRGWTDIAELLLAKGADVNAAYDRFAGNKPPQKEALTPLHYAALMGNRDVAALLLAKGAHVDALDETGETPLYTAAEAGKRDVAELLLAKGADANRRSQSTWSPLLVAAYEGHKDLVELLLAKGADINVKDKSGTTPLHLALSYRHKDVAELLVARGADVNARDNEGNTPRGLANYAALSRSTFEPIWERNSKRANELGAQADKLAKAGDKAGSWRLLSEAVQLSPDDALQLRDFCHLSFDVGRYRDVVWSATKLKAENDWSMSASTQSEWGISLAVLGEYEQAAQIFKEGLEKFPNGEFGDYLREWSIALTYLNHNFIAAREEARAHPVQALGGRGLNGPELNGAVWNLLAKNIYKLWGMAETHHLQYPLLAHLSQAHRLMRDGTETIFLYSQTPEWTTKVGAISRDLAWRTIRLYRSLPVKPLPPPSALAHARSALNVIATQPRTSWFRAIDDLKDVTRQVPWWAEAHYNVAVLLEDSNSGQSRYYDYGYVGPRIIAAQEYMFCVGADPRGSKADAARKMLKEWKQTIPN